MLTEMSGLFRNCLGLKTVFSLAHRTKTHFRNARKLLLQINVYIALNTVLR